MPKDELDAIASASEWTGMLPAVPWNGDTGCVRGMMRVHQQPFKVYRRKKR